MKRVYCATYEGLDAKVVTVESTLTKGLPSFSIVGIASTAINEAKERVKSALLSNDYSFPPKRITFSLAPSELAKSGSQFDLSMALLILLHNSKNDFKDWFVFGELSLDGGVKENTQLYPLILSLANQQLISKAIVPNSSLEKLANIPNIDFYGVDTLNEALQILSDPNSATPSHLKQNIKAPFYEQNGKTFYYIDKYFEDFKDVKGQQIAKRASLISATGFHNIILEGSPGCGKSMIAQRLRYILPPMSIEDILDTAKLQVLDSQDAKFEPLRSFKNPHHTSTPASIFGGGSSKAKIGEIGLANGGILFFDELPHFSKKVLESLREPMQDNKIRISRVNSKIQYDANFLFIGAMNPCPCGNLLDENKECRCSELEIMRYKNRLSEPFLDRIDIYVVMQNVDFKDKADITSKQMHTQVIEANRFRQRRGQINFNAKMSDDEILNHCQLDDEATNILQQAVQRFALSFRAIKKIQKVARTIADLEQSNNIKKSHIFEALSYRKR